MKDILLAVIAMALVFALGWCMAETWIAETSDYIERMEK